MPPIFTPGAALNVSAIQSLSSPAARSTDVPLMAARTFRAARSIVSVIGIVSGGLPVTNMLSGP